MKTITHNDYTQRINKVAEYINSHLDTPIEVKTLANVANLSDFHFCRIFKALKGESPIAFIARLRIETAAQLLRYSVLSVEDTNLPPLFPKRLKINMALLLLSIEQTERYIL